jgi:hypothetical protein
VGRQGHRDGPAVPRRGHPRRRAEHRGHRHAPGRRHAGPRAARGEPDPRARGGAGRPVALAYSNLGTAYGERHDFRDADRYLGEGIAYASEITSCCTCRRGRP